MTHRGAGSRKEVGGNVEGVNRPLNGGRASPFRHPGVRLAGIRR